MPTNSWSCGKVGVSQGKGQQCNGLQGPVQCPGPRAQGPVPHTAEVDRAAGRGRELSTEVVGPEQGPQTKLRDYQIPHAFQECFCRKCAGEAQGAGGKEGGEGAGGTGALQIKNRGARSAQ